MTKTEKYLNKIYGKENPNSLKDDFRKVGLELIQANIKMAKNNTMTRDEVLGEIKKIDEALKSINR